MKNKPAYSIESVDHALRLAILLQQEGPFGVTEAAERIGVARSTAYELVRAGTIPARRLGGRWVISRARFHAWLDADNTSAPTLEI